MALEISSAEGIELVASDGKRYIDLISGISVSNLGHGHPAVKEAIKQQVDKHMHLMVYGEMIQEPQVRLAERLTSLLPDPLNSIYFVNSGSEAVEGALKLARKFTGRSQLISFENAYHGSTLGSLSIMGNDALRAPFAPLLSDVERIRINEDADLGKITKETACVIIEPVQGEAGVITATNDYLDVLAARCRATGTLLIFDEIQTGLGRTGTLYYFMQTPVVPDILLTAKALGGGMPLGAFIASRELMSCLSHDPALSHITTFGGHPVCCAASLAALDVLINEGWMEQVQAKSDLFYDLLKDLPGLQEIRRSGLLLALDFGDAAKVQQLIAACLEQGLILDWFLFNDRSVRIAPPLVLKEEEIRECCGKMREIGSLKL
jgi:acetylornithine/succinyldiaminopimelate/putrescine aminotransferase